MIDGTLTARTGLHTGIYSGLHIPDLWEDTYLMNE